MPKRRGFMRRLMLRRRRESLYSFSRRLEVARDAFARDTTAVLSTGSDFGGVLKSIGNAGKPPAPTATPAR